ncbi:bifunctional DNA-formamidopyrimidine glycosylase/DNA-(apurinic or apyrimidinic site) lyase [Rathayibacter rathayi]|uniref:Bifunctional DNA-formamidopyrimidine glycosylase/DNA-(Apurinic or apyrimidinic site) lyase n=1 Tax=Rathayibacter rathayi TaxID=33887 RepID=A0ABD6WBI1_RATRA|nr:bifunctional DNA-formamidopyrimidine glycosylase/DNA-(apurinic or apyrimidinic site) lyase [Rathayibacter rathayi]AZZ50446.1 bifunctional DNA-formamidopyrimidine glycosylase/DNA-(apurinic or apyrimidinic site) lyase [Rathayibacter rathayi]MWV74074.1 bifunctional DNA-formamidopyrimidine glycosylase/DNA-(apurinic or apyrimidinic site) lyase [Rathayibacter rathayi NCPPB 2980 = VKM Ac-1601]PPF15201.1 bifunctional DNA-formamidopyrimidine glycosylase/DNA-(apurinic or apyrimidinic site) lyase [Ratha
MPELPEVEVVRAGLAPAVTGSLVTGVEIVDERSLKRHVHPHGSFERLLVGRRLEGAVRRGKFLWLPAGRDEALLVHLGMSGQVLLRTADAALPRLARIRVGIEHPEHGELALHFVDQRIFGSMAVDALVPTADGAPGGFAGEDVRVGDWLRAVPSQVAHIARDPLDASFDLDAIVAALARRTSGIKRALLDQTLVSGIGNIYADESLWAAELHPERPSSSLGEARIRRLFAEVRSVLERALAEGGTSFDAQYVNVNGASGYFSHSLLAYGQTGKPCARCGEAIVRVPFMNRSSHLCPQCQQVPR